MSIITSIKAREIIDSRGNPTIEVDVILNDNVLGRAAVPSGASTGAHEAVELRDNDPKRFHGKGVLKAVNKINTEIANCLVGEDSLNQGEIDAKLITLDGTKNKNNLGANSTLGVSLAVAHAGSNFKSLPLFKYLGGTNAITLPVPMMNIINGGEHADNKIDIQEFMIMPVSAKSITDAIRIGSEIFHTLQSELKAMGLSTGVGDEGGFAPDINSTRQAIELIIIAIESSGFIPGKDVFLAIDCAATEYFNENKYTLTGEGSSLTIDQNVEYLISLTKDYPIISIEDGCAEDDWEGWSKLTTELGHKVQLVGDDLFVTNALRLKTGIDKGCGNSMLVKVNQIGTLTETLHAMKIAKGAGYTNVMSHRSGETEDTTIADLAVATNCGQIKTGSLARSDRLAKYNQLIRIEEHLGDSGLYAGTSILKQK